MADRTAVLDRARSMIALAESLGSATPGAAGLAYQAADLACKVLLIMLDGSDIWSHEARRQRLSELLGVDAGDLALLHRTRQLDFYADTAPGAPFELPTAEESQRAIMIARRVIDAALARLDREKLD